MTIKRPKQISPETENMRKIWLQAYREGELVLRFPDKKTAERAKFSLYGAVRSVRKGLDLNPTLLEALNGVEIALRDTALHLIAKRNLTHTSIMTQFAASLPVSSHEVRAMDATDLEAELSLENTMEKLKLMEEGLVPVPDLGLGNELSQSPGTYTEGTSEAVKNTIDRYRGK